MNIVSPPPDDLRRLLPDFESHMRAKNLSVNTQGSYRRVATRFVDWLDTRGLPRQLGEADLKTWRRRVEAHLAELAGEVGAATTAKHYRSLAQFWRWLADEEEILASPMDRMRPPIVPEQPVPCFTDAELVALLEATRGNDFTPRRDRAILRVLLDTGMRLDECAGIAYPGGVDWHQELVEVMGKGRRRRQVSMGPNTVEALRRYVRSRDAHPHFAQPYLWLGRKGRLTGTGIAQMLERLAARAGVHDVHPHRFRHTAAVAWLRAGGTEIGLMRMMGWRSRQMVARYTAYLEAQLAQEEHRRLAPGQRL